MKRGNTGARLGIAAIAALFLLAAPGAASAQVQTVTANVFTDEVPSSQITAASCTPAHCTLREALWPFTPDRIVRLLPGRYELAQSEPIGVQGTKTVNGAGATIDANGLATAVSIIEGADAIINDVTITGGNADAGQSTPQPGGGITIDVATTLTLNRSTVTGNRAGTFGGGIYNGTNNPVAINNSTISGNTAGVAVNGGAGGGIYSQNASSLTITNSTISGNQIVGGRQADGAGIATLGSLDLRRVTIAGNVVAGAVTPGSSLAVSSVQAPAPPPLVIRESIVAADTGVACQIAANRPKTGTHNLDDDGSCAFGAAGDKPGVNPRLGPLQNYGGPTSTRALLPGSPAIGGGNPATCSGLDQRGVLRPQQGTCDIGAFEYVAPRLRVVTQVVNDHGGTRDAADFTVHVRAGADVAGSPQPGSATGTNYTLGGGTYTVSADPLANYAISVAGNCAANGVVTLDDSDAKTCTIVANDPPPQFRKNFIARPKSGTVRVKLPGQRSFRRLREGEQIPLGTTIDTLKGRVTLFAAADDQGNTASSDFYGGIFRVRQTRGSKPITRLILTEKLSCAKTRKATTAARRKKRKRRLWGNGRGRFRTEGQYSSATVRGTKWLVEDRCTSTLTRVVTGRVAVRDRVKKKTVIVRKGKRYIARAKKK